MFQLLASYGASILSATATLLVGASSSISSVSSLPFVQFFIGNSANNFRKL